MITRNSPRVSLLLGGSVVVVVVIQRRRDHSLVATTPREREKTEITERELRGAFSRIREIYSLARRWWSHTHALSLIVLLWSTGFNPRSLFLRERVFALSALSLSLLCLDKKSSITEMTAFWYINTPLWKRAILLRESKCKEIWFILRERDDHSKHPRERVFERTTQKRECVFFALFCPTKDQKFQKDERFSFFRRWKTLSRITQFCSSKFFSQII